MRKLSITALLLLITALAGCGGGGGASTPSPFSGRWVGIFTSNDGGTGTADISIDAKGGVTGTTYDNVVSMGGQVKGTITNAGIVNLNITYTSTVPWSGIMTIQNNGRLGGAVSVTDHTISTCTFDLVKQ